MTNLDGYTVNERFTGECDEPEQELSVHECCKCGEPASHFVIGEDRTPTDRGVEVRLTQEWLCDSCAYDFLGLGGKL